MEVLSDKSIVHFSFSSVININRTTINIDYLKGAFITVNFDE